MAARYSYIREATGPGGIFARPPEISSDDNNLRMESNP